MSRGRWPGDSTTTTALDSLPCALCTVVAHASSTSHSSGPTYSTRFGPAAPPATAPIVSTVRYAILATLLPDVDTKLKGLSSLLAHNRPPRYGHKKSQRIDRFFFLICISYRLPRYWHKVTDPLQIGYFTSFHKKCRSNARGESPEEADGYSTMTRRALGSILVT